MAFNTTRARSNHFAPKHRGAKVGRKKMEEPQLGTRAHYYWTKRNNLETPQVDKDVFAAYIRDYRAKKGL